MLIPEAKEVYQVLLSLWLCKIQQFIIYLEGISLYIHFIEYQLLKISEFIFQVLEHMCYQDLRHTSHLLLVLVK